MICDRGHKISVTAGTAMHRTKLPLHLWFYAAWLLATLKPGISAVQLQRQLGISRLETAWTLLHKRRAAMSAPGRKRLSSFCSKDYHADHWVEVDEVYVGGEEEGTEHRGRGAETKSLVVVAVEVHKWQGDAEEQDDECGVAKKRKERKGKQAFHTKAGRIRIEVIPDAKGVTLDKFINENVVEGSNIWTDGHLGYKKSETLYPRRITVARTSDDPLPTLGRVTTNLKRWLMGTHKGAVQPQHLQAYLNEFVFRFNRREMPWVAFNRALGLAALTRPAVEAGEKLGFLPGDLIQKINPYLRPLYDALFDLTPYEQANRLIERGVIEIAPLAFMRGRTLHSAFIILDEAQNTTREQMKMLLTRTGFDSKVVITADITQIDLPQPGKSGVLHALRILAALPEIAFVHFNDKDVVRHPLVQKIIKAYQKAEAKDGH